MKQFSLWFCFFLRVVFFSFVRFCLCYHSFRILCLMKVQARCWSGWSLSIGEWANAMPLPLPFAIAVAMANDCGYCVIGGSIDPNKTLCVLSCDARIAFTHAGCAQRALIVRARCFAFFESTHCTENRNAITNWIGDGKATKRSPTTWITLFNVVLLINIFASPLTCCCCCWISFSFFSFFFFFSMHCPLLALLLQAHNHSSVSFSFTLELDESHVIPIRASTLLSALCVSLLPSYFCTFVQIFYIFHLCIRCAVCTTLWSSWIDSSVCFYRLAMCVCVCARARTNIAHQQIKI